MRNGFFSCFSFNHGSFAAHRQEVKMAPYHKVPKEMMKQSQSGLCSLVSSLLALAFCLGDTFNSTVNCKTTGHVILFFEVRQFKRPSSGHKLCPQVIELIQVIHHLLLDKKFNDLNRYTRPFIPYMIYLNSYLMQSSHLKSKNTWCALKASININF